MQKLREQMTSSVSKFNACRIQQNQFNMNINRNYSCQQYTQEQNVPPGVKINKAVLNQKNVNQPMERKSQVKTINIGKLKDNVENVGDEQKNGQIQQLLNLGEQQNDFSELWEKVNQVQVNKQNQMNLNTKEQAYQKQINKNQAKSSDSSFELNQQEYEKIMGSLNIGQKENYEAQYHKNQDRNKNNTIYLMDSIEHVDEQKQKQMQNYGSWANIVEQFQNQQKQAKKQIQFPLQEQKDEGQQFQIIDAPIKNLLSIQTQQNKQSKQNNFDTSNNKQQDQSSQTQKHLKYGPWVYNTEYYKIYEKGVLNLIQELKNKNGSNSSSKSLLYESSRPLRKINWEIIEQRKPQSKNLRSKRNCKMNLIQHGRDFLIFDHAQFLLSPVKQNCHLYLGMKAVNHIKTTQNTQLQQNNQSPMNKQYLYLPSTGQILLQTEHYSQKNIKYHNESIKIKIKSSFTGQQLAICDRLIYEQDKNKKQIIEVRRFDFFQQRCTQYLGIIQSRISNFSQQWYCDTIVYVPRRKTYSSKVNDKDWQKLKIQLRLSELGSIVAQLGIFDAESSVTNCILFGQTKFSQFMMGTMIQNLNQIDYILRIAGLSPLMAFVTAFSRKIFVSN